MTHIPLWQKMGIYVAMTGWLGLAIYAVVSENAWAGFVAVVLLIFMLAG